MSSKIGYQFEGKVQEALDRLKVSDGVFYLRLRDSKSAGNFLPNSPADFLVAFQGKTILIECKASDKYSSLRECLADMVDDGQAGYFRWWDQVGNESFYLFYSERLGQVECWAGDRVLKARQYGKKIEGLPDQEYGLDELEGSLLGLML
jgi:hypothetical protein